jgi:hypothetical protein
MPNVEGLKKEVQKLNRAELARFRDWFLEYDSDRWDVEMEEDVEAGKLDGLAEEALAEYRAGKTSEM